MPVRFDDSLPFTGNDVLAIGPLDAGDTIKEVCAWVFQPTTDRQQDSAATEMTTDAQTGRPAFRQTDTRWLLRLSKVGSPANRFRPGPAFAVAVALIETSGDERERERERVVWWGHPVVLIENPAYIEAADTLLSGPAGPDSHVSAFHPPLDKPVT
jgi:hypothetical protein